MKNPKLIYFLLLNLFIGCQLSDKTAETVAKYSETDNFKNTMVKSQFFTINLAENNTIESKKGNIIIVPEGSFVDKNGDVVNDNVQIEFAEASELDEMILSNLFIQDAEKMVKNHLSFYINASRKEEQLRINPENPVYIEVAADINIDLYKTTRDEKGNMQLGEKLEPIKYLTPVPFESLNFLPPGFELEVEKGLPFRGHITLTKDLVDSLYYSFSAELKEISRLERINEISYYQFVDSVPRWDSYSVYDCCIDPASIKVIKTKKIENTLIATREFESRLEAIFATCNNSVLELYINNLDKNLWEIDEKVANLLGNEHKLYEKFTGFASLKQTKVELSNKRAQFLAKQFLKQREKIEKEIRKLRQEFLNLRRKKDIVAQKKREEYSELLRKRHKYRMNKFGFELTEVGWYNAAEVTTLEDLETFKLNVTIENGNKYDRVYTYVVNQKIKSIFSLLSDDNIHFDKVFKEDPDLLLWENQKFKVLAVAYKNDNVAYKIEEHEQSSVININMQLENRDLIDFRKDLKEFTHLYKKENKISIDLEYQKFFYKEKKGKELEMEEEVFLFGLKKIVYPCCHTIYNGTIIFENERLEYVFYILSKVYGVSLWSDDESIKDMEFTIVFSDISIERIIEIIEATCPIESRKENDSYEFYRDKRRHN